MNKQLGYALIISVAAVLSTTNAQAGDVDNGHITRTVTIGYQDLRLETQAGVETLYTRLEEAAKRVCGQADSRNMAAQRDLRRCRRDALDAAVSDIGDERLSRMHNGDASITTVAAAD